MTEPLPGTPGPTLAALWDGLTSDQRAALRPHLLGTTSADWLTTVLREHGLTVSASTIRNYRRATRQEGGVHVG
ncbi:hypothetical protein [Lentzea sp. NEAU-D7]|uniref:hypothetical protein n=1 Tax=Lentzea sp. NEAU-D7 TaxID=2994667 RepID=UPI00224A7228|nr:hypothetical protein [Lentzea sp. NEAU-D7]MCX2949965.1 hypothetical protein [Lentzea sp. NEAU-D7]